MQLVVHSTLVVPLRRHPKEPIDDMIKAGALIVGDRQGSGAAIYDIAADLGFSFVHPFSGRGSLAQAMQATPIVFVLFSEIADPRRYEPALRDIRRASPRELAFAPTVLFAESPSRQEVSDCSALGFDDILTMPFTRDRIYLRLMRQIETPIIYFETGDYFGPDRRRSSGPRIADAYLRGIDQARPARRYEIRRSFHHGTMVMREEVVGVSRSVA